MIFVTLGSQHFQFNRLLKAVDMLVGDGLTEEPVYAQTGYSDYKPKNYKYKTFMDRDEFGQMMERSDTVITHGGTGVIIGAVKKGKKVIAVPRLSKYGEHVDDHQIQLIREFAEENLICGILEAGSDETKLEQSLKKALEEVRGHEYSSYTGSTQLIIDSIASYIEGLG